MILKKLIEDERVGNKGRRIWLEVTATSCPAEDYIAMLEGAIATIDKLLDALDELRIEPQATEEG